MITADPQMADLTRAKSRRAFRFQLSLGLALSLAGLLVHTQGALRGSWFSLSVFAVATVGAFVIVSRRPVMAWFSPLRAGESRSLDLLLEFVEATAGVDAETLFPVLIGQLSRTLGVRCAMFLEFASDDPHVVRTLAVCVDGQLRDGAPTALASGLISPVVERSGFVEQSGVRRMFPDDPLLSELAADGFAGAPVRAGDGPVLGVLAVLDDRPLGDRPMTRRLVGAVAARCAVELVRQRSLVSLRHSERHYRLLTESLSDNNRAKSEFLANMSHEIRTPMTAILGFADLLRENIAKPENKEAIETIRRNGEHLLGLINDILDLSKVEAGKLEVERVAYSPWQLLVEVEELMHLRAQSQGLTLKLDFDGPIPASFDCDPTRVRQILVNLAGNAIKFTDQGEIRLVLRLLSGGVQGALLEFEVSDTGIGMTPEQMSRLFHPFSQADSSTTRKFGGTGLGLAISQRLAKMLDGEIICESRIGLGSCFRLRIPIGDVEHSRLLASPAEMTRSRADEVRRQEAARLDFRVLLAEDSPDNQRLIVRILGNAGAEVSVVENGQLAVDAALAANEDGRPYEVVLMDMQMPVLDGYSATRRLRAAGYAGAIISLTAHAMSGERDRCLAVGCDDYATKPIDRRALIELVSRYARRPHAVAR